MRDPDLQNIDDRIQGPVRALRDGNWPAIESLGGSDEQPDDPPTIAIKAASTFEVTPEEQMNAVASTLQAAGYDGFTVSFRSMYRGKSLPWKTYLTVEFCGDDGGES